ncbi:MULTISPECIES: glycosyltransferase family 2 protein [unclassified Acinetobacter]|uniref:glycosyltransferase family 2 protein n=1 Tax=unclassified Acinetobacter TaxID=196816 RepID=UPI0015D335DB|nr:MULTISPECIES: glycosyltransferase family 2 protein [unclassified Acinetobacter]
MISVILTHYNKGLLLNRTIESLQPQNENLHEIIVVDDCSTDPEWCKNSKYLLDTYPKIKIIQNTDNKGPAVRLNQGAFSATGDYLFFMDADDVLAPNRLNMFLEEMQKQNADLCYAEKVKIHDVNEIQKHTTGIWESSTTPLSYVLENNIMQMCVMCTRELFLKSRGCNENIFIQDESLALNLARYSQKIISSDLHSVFVILDKSETKTIRGENRLSRHLEQQHHDMFFTINDFIQDNPELLEKDKKLLTQKALSTYWKSIRHTPKQKISDFFIYLTSRINPISTWDTHRPKLITYFNQLDHVRKINNRE